MIKFFTASWCVPCNNMKAQLQEGDLDNVILVDIDNEPAETAAANVRSVPTLIRYDENGTEVDRLTGTVGRSQFLSFVNE